MHTVSYKRIEFFLIYVVLPISFVFEYPFVIKAALAISGFLYIIFLLLKVYKYKFRLNPEINWRAYWLRIMISLIVIAFMTILYVGFTAKDSLFQVVSKDFNLWFTVLLIYIIFSVYPQELIYRTFFFQRYEPLFKSKYLFIVVNALVFSLAHISYGNTLVLFITFLGGLLFALTYYVTRSTFLVSVEHAIYGCWLFTVGMGHMLGFPG